MPELPEVETTCRGISPHIVKRKISKVVIRQHQLRWPIPKNLPKFLEGYKVKSISRRGKYILMSFAHGTLLLHLGMSGRLCITTSAAPVEKHDHVDICFGKSKILRYTDPRRFGSIHWTKDNPLQHKLLINLGPEPLEEGFTGNHLLNAAKNKKRPVKQFIMDPNVVVGVGNIYANEALFKAKISPLSQASSISLRQYNKLVKDIKEILAKSIKQGGTTLKDFLSGEGKPGYFSQSLLVYGRSGKPCTKCKTTLLEKKLGQRATVYCNNCQPVIC